MKFNLTEALKTIDSLYFIGGTTGSYDFDDIAV